MSNDVENVYDFRDEALQVVQECWKKSVRACFVLPDELLINTLVDSMSFWMQTAAQNQRNTDYYRGLLEKCGRSIGVEAYMADDDSLSDSVLCAKIPELVEELLKGQ